jgi:uncharacterized protein
MIAARLKKSQFNVPVGPIRSDGTPERLYNTSTGNYLCLDAATTAIYRRLLDNDQIYPSEAGILYDAGFAIAEEINEVAAVRYAFEHSRKQKASPHLTIAPTLSCNFGCDYCFEQHVRGLMSPAVQDALTRFLKSVMVDKDNRALSVSWFGGEPIIGFSVIKSLSTEFMKMRDRGDISYSSNIITNGHLLKATTARELVRLGVANAQITIDGPRHIHDKRRVIKGSRSSTFDQIIDNISNLPDELTVTLRVNVDKDNRDYVEDLLYQLDELMVLPRVSVSVARVENFSKRDSPGYLLTAVEFAEFEVALSKKAELQGWPLYVSPLSPRIVGVCQVDSPNSFLVSPTGELFKCWAELGNNGHVVGHLLKPETWTKLRPTRLTARDPFDDLECVTCALLPSCMGSCPLIRQNNKELGKKVCPPFKHNYAQILQAQFGGETRIVNYLHEPASPETAVAAHG